jgi:hypothetical protein
MLHWALAFLDSLVAVLGDLLSMSVIPTCGPARPELAATRSVRRSVTHLPSPTPKTGDEYLNDPLALLFKRTQTRSCSWSMTDTLNLAIV